MTKALNWEDISIIEVVSTLTEMTFVLREKDISLAFNTVKETDRRAIESYEAGDARCDGESSARNDPHYVGH